MECCEQIGSVKGPKNFGSDQTVFHRDDVPAARRERKKEVKEVMSLHCFASPLFEFQYFATALLIIDAAKLS